MNAIIVIPHLMRNPEKKELVFTGMTTFTRTSEANMEMGYA